MIDDDKIKAKIDSEKTMIQFIDATTSGSSEEAREQEYLQVIEELEQQNKRIVKLMGKMEKVDSGIKSSPDYIKKSLESRDGAAFDQTSGGDMQIFTWILSAKIWIFHE